VPECVDGERTRTLDWIGGLAPGHARDLAAAVLCGMATRTRRPHLVEAQNGTRELWSRGGPFTCHAHPVEPWGTDGGTNGTLRP